KYQQKKWLDAAGAYEVFIRMHPRHEELAYASYRLGESYFYAVPTGFFLYPEPASREQTHSKEALAALERFILQFPQSDYVPDAKKKLAAIYAMLAKHDSLIADYYKRRGRYEAAIARYERVNELYPETDESAEALFQAAQIAKDNLKDEDRALSLLNQIVEQKPTSPYAKKAREMLNKFVPKAE
ncbi:MAG TPA: outer membrane protein assembly factor BamD, partial [Myxococcota bacterium]|nr:outer membrane protein assembly factor BamD [Myxococcota bacterium]